MITGVLKRKVIEALTIDPTIATPIDVMDTTQVLTEEYLLTLGLTPVDLKKLERGGVAVRKPYQFTRSKRSGTGKRGGPSGIELRTGWILIGRKSNEETVQSLPETSGVEVTHELREG